MSELVPDMDLKHLAATLHASMPGEKITLVEDDDDHDHHDDERDDAGRKPNRCHANAVRWIDSHPDYRIVPGWIPVPYETLPNRLRFHSHSMVEDASGQLRDVTLTADQASSHRFIRHPGPTDAFYAAVANQGLPSIEHVLAPDPAWPIQGDPNTGDASF
ncbi:MAG: hypothetical protein PSV23_12130 [Brevundimonas sp.]|uniref:hypothetical protein n=1 Tax=Brevundimonas sp. TaxID=1871086 RepID=UPI002487F4BA|nr:hypothetical protein [Brevundimonas sp.]MDI1327531.1 hypothetical protein [Brevundimonas sp.]